MKNWEHSSVSSRFIRSIKGISRNGIFGFRDIFWNLYQDASKTCQMTTLKSEHTKCRIYRPRDTTSPMYNQRQVATRDVCRRRWDTGLPVRLDEVHLGVLDAKTLNMHTGRFAGCRLSARCITADLIPISRPVVIHIESNLHFKLVYMRERSFFFPNPTFARRR